MEEHKVGTSKGKLELTSSACLWQLVATCSLNSLTNPFSMSPFTFYFLSKSLHKHGLPLAGTKHHLEGSIITPTKIEHKRIRVWDRAYVWE